MKRKKRRILAIKAVFIVAALCSLSIILAGPSNAAPRVPAATCGSFFSQPAPTLESNPHGEFISFGVKWTCTAPVEFSISLFLRVNKGNGFTDVTFCSNSGVSSAPSCFSDTNNCINFTEHPYLTEVDATVNGVFFNLDSPEANLFCTVN